MSACPDKAMLLQGLLDGELDAVNAAACEAHLKACEGCAAEFSRLQAIREAVTAPGVAYRAPDRLRSGIEAMIATDAPSAATPRRRIPRVGYAAGGALGGLLAASLAFVAILPQVTEASVERQLVASHVRSLMANHLTDVATSDRHVVKPWFNGKADVAPPVPELSAEGFPLVGGRLDYVDGHAAPAIVYSRRRHTVNLFVWPATGGLAGGLAGGDRTAQRDGYSLVEWTQGGLRFAAVSDIDPAELRQFKAAYLTHEADVPH